ncbi:MULTISPECIES: hypothetical protein [Streptomyces]|uniref:hypothetical protein n=1 Tax=Streptomyces TaxID=1883 RepID=UPI000AF79AA8|nr:MULTISPECIES: hypothetical protein [Streptomyces]
MDRPSRATLPRPTSDPAPDSYAQLTNGGWCHVPAHTRLALQRRSVEGGLPAPSEVQWVSFAALPVRACAAERCP